MIYGKKKDITTAMENFSKLFVRFSDIPIINSFIFSSMGASQAGLIGLTITITNAIIVVSTSFISASIPMLGKIVEAGKDIDAYKNFFIAKQKIINLWIIPFILRIFAFNKFSYNIS